MRLRTEVRHGIRAHHGVVADFAADAFYDFVPNWRISGGPRLSLASRSYYQAYYAVSLGEAITSGLSPYSPGGGLKSIGALTWKTTDRITTSAFAEYSRLMGPAAQSSLVRERGSRDQLMIGLSATYCFDFSLQETSRLCASCCAWVAAKAFGRRSSSPIILAARQEMRRGAGLLPFPSHGWRSGAKNACRSPVTAERQRQLSLLACRAFACCIHSPLSRIVTCDGITVMVEIYKLAGTDARTDRRGARLDSVARDLRNRHRCLRGIQRRRPAAWIGEIDRPG